MNQVTGFGKLGNIVVEHNGKTYRAAWHVINDYMFVTTELGRKQSRLHNHSGPFEPLAEQMLREIVSHT